MKPQLSQKELHEIVSYDKLTGKLTWLERTLDYFNSENSCKSWNAKHAGKIIKGHPAQKSRYGLRICVFNNIYGYHTIVWLFNKCTWPEETLEFIDNDKYNTRYENLRECSRCKVQHKINKANKNNFTTGERGVWVNNRARKPYKATCILQGKKIYLGTFDTLLEAKQEYRDFRAMLLKEV